MIEALIVLHIVIGFFALSSKKLLDAVVFMAVFSLLTSLLCYLLHAPDVAITEAAVGAGVSTVLFVWIVHKTERVDKT